MKNLSTLFVFSLSLLVSGSAMASVAEKVTTAVSTVSVDVPVKVAVPEVVLTPAQDSFVTSTVNSVKSNVAAATNWVSDKAVATYTWVQENPVSWVAEHKLISAAGAAAVAAAAYYYYYVYKVQQEQERACLYAE